MKTPFKLKYKSPLLQTAGFKPKNAKVVETQDPKSGKTYGIEVEEGSAYAKFGAPQAFRAIDVTQQQDPLEKGISAEESKSRAKEYQEKDWQMQELKKKMAKSKKKRN